jgi:molybdopterin converting factor small subunit
MSVARLRAGSGTVRFLSTANRLGDVLRELVDSYRMSDIFMTESGEVRQWARVLVNGRSQEFLGGLNLELHDDDTLALVYPYAENF